MAAQGIRPGAVLSLRGGTRSQGRPGHRRRRLASRSRRFQDRVRCRRSATAPRYRRRNRSL